MSESNLEIFVPIACVAVVILAIVLVVRSE